MARDVGLLADPQIQGKRAELYVFGELAKRGLLPYVPVVDVEGIDAIVRPDGGEWLELQIKALRVSGGKAPGWVQVDALKPEDGFFIIFVEAPQAEISDVWILPSRVFDAYASRPPKGRPRDLDLDSGKRKFGQPLREILCGFRNRWELLTDYVEYQELMTKPEDLEDVLAMHEALESTETEMKSLDEYEERRKAQV